MEYRSLAISFRIQLGFHAANNEGAGGTNVMEPRRITVGDKEYDGISGEIIRHHILEEFVGLCQTDGVTLHQRCQGLVPDRGLTELVKMIQDKQWKHTRKDGKKVNGIDPEHYPEATREMIQNCALCDIAGYLYPLGEATRKIEIAMGSKVEDLGGTLKRDSCFEIGWLITEHPAIVDYTQHSAYDPSPEFHNIFVQNMRTGIYGGILRVDLDRIGFNDWWWLQNGFQKYAIDEEERKKRIRLLLEAIRRWLISPSFAKQAGWLQHMSGLLEGAIVLSKDGPAPFFSPIWFELEDNDPNKPIIKPNPGYRDRLDAVKKQCGDTLEVYHFDSPDQLKEKMQEVQEKFGSTGGTKHATQSEEGT
ncbi:MAG: DevR family CRISPR-associated autoregulator [Deltaproteobacteria bacterium]|nr:MAG: DevR family CRISPR-associated autoregulator [Deltaproteobacteria bacterium]